MGTKTAKAVTNLPGNAIDVASGLTGLTVKGVAGLPSNALHLAGNLTTLAARTVLQQKKDIVAATQASKTPLTSPMTKIEVQIECGNLRRKDAFSECDAFCVLWQVPNGYNTETAVGIVGGGDGHESQSSLLNQHVSLSTIASFATTNSTASGVGGSGRKRQRVSRLPTPSETEMGRTEVAQQTCDPQFQRTFSLDYRFQLEQTYVVRVYDRDLEFCPDLKEHDFLGGAVFTLGELMGLGKNRKLKWRLKGSNNKKERNNKSWLCVRGNEVKSTRSVLDFRFSADTLKEKKDKVNKVIEKDESPFFQIMKLNPEDQSWATVYKSEVLMQNKSPTWVKASLPLPVICGNGNSIDSLIKVSFWDWIRVDQAEPLGYLETTVRELVDGASHGIPVLDVWQEHKRRFGGYKLKKSGGVMKVLRADLKPVPSMLDYIAGGVSIDLMVAVDCSSHNGNPNDESGLHYRPGPMWLNDYQAAINKIGTIMEPFAHSQEFSIIGFGATARGETVTHFPMGDDKHGAVKGAKGLLDAYDTLFIDNPQFIEPVDHVAIAPLIQTAMYRAIQKSENDKSYSVLCILTAGKFDEDLLKTIDTLCTAAEDAPLSIVIIGVGENKDEFDGIQMVFANGEKLIHSNGVPIARDIVGFSAFPDHGHNAGEAVEAAFDHLQEQFVQYFNSNGIAPSPPQINGSEFEDDFSSSSMQDDSQKSAMSGSSRRRGGRRSKNTTSRKKLAKPVLPMISGLGLLCQICILFMAASLEIGNAFRLSPVPLRSSAAFRCGQERTYGIQMHNGALASPSESDSSEDISVLHPTAALLQISFDGRRFTGWSSANDPDPSEASVVPRRRRRGRGRWSRTEPPIPGYVRSVQGVLQNHLAKMYGNVDPELVVVEGCSRTDKGVHARSMYAMIYGLDPAKSEWQEEDSGFTYAFSKINGRCDSVSTKRVPHPVNGNDSTYFLPVPKPPLPNLAFSLNRMLPPDIRVVGIAPIPNMLVFNDFPTVFHPSISALTKTYVYTFSVASQVEGPDNNILQTFPDPTTRRFVWHVPANGPFDLDKALQACEMLQGTHDFASFQGAPRGESDRLKRENAPPEYSVCTIESISVKEKVADVGFEGIMPTATQYTVEVTGDRFLYKMVRFLVGALVSVGLEQHGSLDLNSLKQALEHPTSTKSFQCAPAHGLVLHDVNYGVDMDWQPLHN